MDHRHIWLSARQPELQNLFADLGCFLLVLSSKLAGGSFARSAEGEDHTY